MSAPLRRRLAYGASYWRRWTVLAPVLWLVGRWRRQATVECHDGIHIADMGIDPSDRARFVAAVHQALELVAAHDPREYRTVRRELAAIVNAARLSPATYDPAFRSCTIDFAWMLSRGAPTSSRGTERMVTYIAGCIVHEATHGRIHSWLIPYTPATRERIERICRAEELRFMSRLEGAGYDVTDLVKPFDPQQWRFAWHAGPVARWRAIRRRILAAVWTEAGNDRASGLAARRRRTR